MSSAVTNGEVPDGGNIKKKVKRSGPTHSLTVKEIISDSLTSLSLEYWAPLGAEEIPQPKKPFDPKIIEDIYFNELAHFNIQRVMLLELSHYLENYLWPNFNPKTSTYAHVMSIIVMVNEKFRETVQAWDCFHTREDVFSDFFLRILTLGTEREFTVNEKIFYIVFLINCYQSLEDPMLRQQCLKLVSYPLWFNITPGRLQQQLKALPKLKRHFEFLKKKEAEEKHDSKAHHERNFIPDLIKEFFDLLNEIPSGGHVEPRQVLYMERFLEFMIDLSAQLPTRRFFHIYLADAQLVVRCRMSALAKLPQGRLFSQLLDILKFYEGFEINDYTGNSLTDAEMSASHADRIQELQRLAFKSFQPELKELALSNIASLETRPAMLKHLSQLSEERIRQLCVKLNIVPDVVPQPRETREFLLEIIVAKLEKRISQLDAINEMPLYPTETLLWDENVVPSENYTGETVLALPKLNLQFLTFHDYLLRNFNLFRLESTYEIKDDIQDIVKRVNAHKEFDGSVSFSGWSRMALPIKDFKVTNVAKPHIGENKPAQVVAEVTWTLGSTRGPIREEWENIKQHDILFLLTIRPKLKGEDRPDPNLPFREQYGVQYIRGCEVMEVLDEENNVIKDTEVEKGRHRSGQRRTARIHLDSAQYQIDLVHGVAAPVYDSFNLVLRRKPKENNFKAVLETIRDLMNSRCVVPDWLHDTFLGYGDPGASTSIGQIPTVNFNDTFITLDHLTSSFPGQKFKFSTQDPNDLVRPFKISFPDSKDQPMLVQPYVPINMGPYPQDKPKQNQVPFTPVQIEAIRSGINEGLTMVVGPPGTGKTDVAVQIISNLYHNFPTQRTLLVTHSNQALNQLFEKIMALDIHERHLLRLGHGEKSLETDKDFSKFGRVNYMLSLRLSLLAGVERLATSLGVVADVAYTCETASYFYLMNVLARWEEFLKKSALEKSSDSVAKNFPFLRFFDDAPQPLFHSNSFEEDMEIAQSCFRHLNTIFTQLEECRSFELMKSSYDRANYLLTKQAKIIAMTCTHAALKRADLVTLGFKYDNLLMEEAAQILEIETFIPMLLQNTDEKEGSRLKRVILIGDHHQLPPIVKNMAFQKYSHLDQSLFARFVRLGVPTIDLDSQGRARPSIAELYNWRYKSLGNLPGVLTTPEYHIANPGFAHDYQLIDVADYEGRGESEPNPHFYQNLGEAEYVVAVFMYMRLLGYPANKITVITTYNGQKHLIRDVVKQRCAWNPTFGTPHKITTVDRYQGQQNDFRTKTVGHIRDVRRLVVAMSRARLGLYVFCRKSLFENCYELTPTFSKLVQRTSKMMLVQNETYPTERKMGDTVQQFQVEDVVHMGSLVSQGL